MEELKKIIDAAVCEWSMDNGHALTESELNDLVDRITGKVVEGGHAL